MFPLLFQKHFTRETNVLAFISYLSCKKPPFLAYSITILYTIVNICKSWMIQALTSPTIIVAPFIRMNYDSLFFLHQINLLWNNTLTKGTINQKICSDPDFLLRPNVLPAQVVSIIALRHFPKDFLASRHTHCKVSIHAILIKRKCTKASGMPFVLYWCHIYNYLRKRTKTNFNVPCARCRGPDEIGLSQNWTFEESTLAVHLPGVQLTRLAVF